MTWRSSAACRHHSPALFFDPRTYKSAQAICASCPVIGECRAAAQGETHGVWAGVVCDQPSRHRSEDRMERKRRAKQLTEAERQWLAVRLEEMSA